MTLCACGAEVYIRKTGECHPCYNRRYKREVLGRKPAYDWNYTHDGRVRRRGRPLLKHTDLHQPITYNTAHTRLLSWRGSAKHHLCADCGKQAAEWSYSGKGRHEMRGTKVNGWGTLIEVAWSTEASDWDPRCHQCHVQYDRKPDAGAAHPRRVEQWLVNA